MELPIILGEDRYSITDRLGGGGMAEVYRGYDHALECWRAFKVLRRDRASHPWSQARFETEARAMALLDHPMVVRVYDIEREGDLLYIVMELVTGGSVGGWVAEHGPMHPRLATRVCIDVCRGLAFAHARGIVHRDVNPWNILIRDTGRCCLSDFGIAQTHDEGHTRTGDAIGTIGFMAPEQRDDAKRTDHRGDIYAVGATLHHLLTGRAPAHLFMAAQDAEKLAGVPETLAPVILRASAYRPEDRFESAEELAAALEAALVKLPPIPPDSAALYDPSPRDGLTRPLFGTMTGGQPAAAPPRRAQRRLGVFATLVALFAVPVALLVVGIPWHLDQPEVPREHVPQPEPQRETAEPSDVLGPPGYRRGRAPAAQPTPPPAPPPTQRVVEPPAEEDSGEPTPAEDPPEPVVVSPEPEPEPEPDPAEPPPLANPVFGIYANTQDPIDHRVLKRVFTGRMTHWSDGIPVIAVLPPPNSGASRWLAERVGVNEITMRRLFAEATFRGAPPPLKPRSLQGAAEALELPGAIGVALSTDVDPERRRVD